MAERFTADLLFIIIVLLIAALLGFLIGYYLEKGRCKKKCDILEEEIASLKAKIKKLEEEKLHCSRMSAGWQNEETGDPAVGCPQDGRRDCNAEAHH